MSKTANELVNFAKSKLGTNYVYGMKGAVLTDSKLRSLANSYPKYLTYNKEKGKIGTVCTDCSGLISWCTGKVRGSSQYKETATRIEPISNINGAVAGCALWQQGHIGIYIGNGECIEARGSAYGTVKTKVANRKFTHILWLCDIDYDNSVQVPQEPSGVSYKVKVDTPSGVNCRNAPNGAKVKAYANGTELTISKEENGWGYTGEGWVSLQYCTKVQGNSSSNTKSTGTYEVRVDSALIVRSGPGTNYSRKSKSQLTVDGQKHSNDNGGLLNGTRVTVSKWNGNWAKIPSGWVSGDYLKKV